MFARVRKLIAAVVGLAVFYAQQETGMTFGSEFTDTIVSLAVMAGTAFGVWAVPNDEA